MDNDIYGHVNNVVYYSYFDTVINDYLIREGGLDIHDGEVIGICAESTCQFKASFTFPESIEAGLRVGHLGNRSVRSEIGRSEERRSGKSVSVRVELGGRRLIKKKIYTV